MASYRCYFFGEPGFLLGAPRSIETAVDLDAASDEAARRIADDIYRRRRNRKCGFELWHGERLVHVES